MGQGGGRQFKIAEPASGGYAITDISPVVLANPLYARVPHYRIQDYIAPRIWLGRFEVVHSWYVVHHLHPEELEAFFRFMATCLQYGGVALFNFAGDSKPRSAPNRGFETQGFSKSEIEAACCEVGLTVRKVTHEEKPHNNIVIAEAR